MTRGQILNQAANCVTKDRENTYGTPEDNFKLIAALWSNYVSSKAIERVCLDAEDVAVMMALLKIARIAMGKPNADNYIDLAGYAACAGEIATKEDKADET